MSSTQPPKPSAFRNPTLIVLGESTNFQSGVSVAFDALCRPVFSRFGLNPDELDNLDMFRNTLYATLYRAARIRVPLFQLSDGASWSLTEAGVKEASILAPRKAPAKKPQNITGEFLARRLKATGGLSGPLWNLFRTTLRAHLTISDTTDRIEDHIQTAMTRLISRDSLRERLLGGQSIEDTQLSSYILRSAYNDCRDEGTEPTSREMYGALTERERSTGVKRGPVSDSRAIWSKDSDKWDTAMIAELRDTEGPATREAIIDTIYFDECWQKLEAIIKAKKPHAWKRYLAVLKLKAEGARVKEIAEIEKVSPYRAASIISEVRRVVREAKDENLLDFLY